MSTVNLGARFTADALEATLRENYGSGVDADLPEALRFVRGVARLAIKRFRGGAENPSDKPIIFLLHSADIALETPTRPQRVVPMLDNGRSMLGGSVWFVNYAVTEGTSLGLAQDDDDAKLFEFVREELSFGHLPAAIVETRDGVLELLFYPKGLDRSELAERTDLSRKTISPEEVYEALDEIYARELCSPSSQTPGTSTWKNAREMIPSDEAEARVQRVLKVGLSEHFQGFIVRQEQTQQSGRLDLEIEEPHPEDSSTVTRHILLELKVLRAKHVGGSAYPDAKNLENIADGLNQARAYRDERHVRASALCCFDMRATPIGQHAFHLVVTDAKAWNVDTWIWHLYNTDKAYRDSTKPAEPEPEPEPEPAGGKV